MSDQTSKYSLPVQGATLPFWRTQLHPLDTHRSTEVLPAECDVLIIGAGYAGVSTAYHLFKQSALPPSVVMLEAREVCSGASGRNGGNCKPDVYYNILKYTQKYGPEQAAEFAKYEAANVLAVKQLVEQEGIDCDFVLTRGVDVYLDEQHAKATKAAYDELQSIGTADLADVHYTEGPTAEKVSGIKAAKCCFSFTAAHLWPYKLVTALLFKLVEKGLNLQTQTPVTSISETSDSEGRWTVSTPRGQIKTKKLVLAANAYTAAVAPQFRDRIVPVRGICSHITARDPERCQRLSTSYSIRLGKSLYDYLVPRLDGSIVVGGAKPAFWTDQSQWYQVSDDSKLIAPAAKYFDGLMQKHFVGWEDSGAATDAVWTGIMGWTTDLMPYVGEVPDKPGQYILAGFNGHGMVQIHLASKAIAGMLTSGFRFEQTGLPSLFKPSRKRLLSERNDILGIPSTKL